MSIDKARNMPTPPNTNNRFLNALLKPFRTQPPTDPRNEAIQERDEMYERMKSMTVEDVGQALKEQRDYVWALEKELKRAQHFLSVMLEVKKRTW